MKSGMLPVAVLLFRHGLSRPPQCSDQGRRKESSGFRLVPGKRPGLYGDVNGDIAVFAWDKPEAEFRYEKRVRAGEDPEDPHLFRETTGRSKSGWNRGEKPWQLVVAAFRRF